MKDFVLGFIHFGRELRQWLPNPQLQENMKVCKLKCYELQPEKERDTDLELKILGRKLKSTLFYTAFAPFLCIDYLFWASLIHG